VAEEGLMLDILFSGLLVGKWLEGSDEEQA
jgi:hypothetical protein